MSSVLSPHKVIKQQQASQGEHQSTKTSSFPTDSAFRADTPSANAAGLSHILFQASQMSSSAHTGWPAQWSDEMGIAAGCSGHRIAPARCCVTRDYVRAEAAASSESRRARCHLHAPWEDSSQAFIMIFFLFIVWYCSMLQTSLIS